MSSYTFTPAQRFAIYTVHGEICYMCSTPLDLMSMEVDHVLPECLIKKDAERLQAQKSLGLSADFEINSYENWLPACGPCNGRKREAIFSPSPLIQLTLERAKAKAADVASVVSKTLTRNKLTRAMNTLARARADGLLDPETIREISEFATEIRAPELAGKSIRLTPAYEVLSESGEIRIIRGPYGIGYGPRDNVVSNSMRCPTCGSVYWSGARCVVCGEMDEG